MYQSHLREKFNESLTAVLPIAIIVLLLSFTVAPVPAGTLLGFILASVLLIVGMTLFNMGAELAMEPMGQKMGAGITKTKKLWLILFVGFFLGFLITMSEPDLQVLANQISSVPSMVLIVAVALGVGIFLVIALLRILFGWSLRLILIISYAAVFILTAFMPKGFLAVAFDSGGVTTGPMTVPFIMAFGVGISAIRSDKSAADDSFGLVSLCSVGPILAVEILSIIYNVDGADYTQSYVPNALSSTELSLMFVRAFPTYIKEIAVSVLPIAAFFAVLQFVLLKLNKINLKKIAIGLAYTYVGLVLFLTGANVGFMPAGSYLGQTLAGLSQRWVIIPIGMLIGFFIVRAEPAVYVLMQQVEELTDGAVQGKVLRNALSVGICASVGLAIIRVLTGISILWFVIPGYLLAIVMAFFVPKVFTAVAFDSGGVASGPMTATFLLPFAIGACTAVGGDIVADSFGVVAMVAMTPLITIQALAVLAKLKPKKNTNEQSGLEHKYEIIEL